MSDRICPICSGINPPGAMTCGSCGASLAGASAATETDALPHGSPLKGGEYRVGKALGQGGFGITYLGSQQRLLRSVALKEFFPSGSRRQGLAVRPGGSMKDEDYKAARERFIEEAKTLSRFQHPGIVRIYDYFEENETAYMAMEYLRGETLAKLLNERKGPLPEREALGYIRKIADALIEIHQAGLLHRDVKPDNIVVTQSGEAVLIDFGSARAFAAGMTSRMTAIVTPGYAPLEQYGQRAQFGSYTDLYALGATLYHLLTGEPPVSATDRAAGVELPPVRRINPRITESAEKAVMAALQIAVTKRPQSVAEWLALFNAPLRPSSPAKPKPVNIDAGLSSNILQGEIRVNPRDGAEMVFIPAGEFLMGADDGDLDEKPAHTVYLEGFWIYKTPVTVAQYHRFCVETGRLMPLAPSWGWRDDHPIVNVSWHAANDYAEWAGVRLPTEAEWEKAARGTDGRKYPWGNEWNARLLQCSKRVWGSSGGTAPVGSFPGGASPYGVLDMAGNIWEWTADRYLEDYYASSPNKNPTGPKEGTQRVLRGGSWDGKSSNSFRASHRYGDGPDVRVVYDGFRCASKFS